MAVAGIEYVYLETRDFSRSVEFWKALGFELVLDLGRAGRMEPPGGGPGVFLEEASAETPLAGGIYLEATDGDLVPEVELVGDRIDTHWGTQLQKIRDPDGREFILQHTPER